MGRVVFVVRWYVEKYEEPITMGAWFDKELAKEYIAEQPTPTQYGIETVAVEDS